MLRGNYPGRVDAKGRLKIPVAFLTDLGSIFYVTSENGDYVRIYPMAVWHQIEDRLARISSHNRTKQKFLLRANYYGQVVELDGQGRVLIPAILREAAQMVGDVDILGNLNYIEVWKHERFVQLLAHSPITREDDQILDDLGI